MNTQPAGASIGTSVDLRRFIESAVGLDVVDASPAPLPSIVFDKEVTDTTLFPLNKLGDPSDATIVSFRFKDKFGNIGIAKSSVRVVEQKK